jgi:uncharacterized membrane protein
VTTSRLEAFSDGVMAVAITLLALGLVVPPLGQPGPLDDKLTDAWPSYVAFVVSFLTIGIIWINHHAMISRLREADHEILGLNLLLLMSIVALPFTTNLMATYLQSGSGEQLAAGIYSGSFLIMGCCFGALQRHILVAKPTMLAQRVSEAERRKILRRALSGLIPYALATALAVVSPYVTLAICGAVAAFYASPASRGGQPVDRDADAHGG